MPIVTLQRQLRELGRIRTGNQVAGAKGKRPNKLETFRLTSDSRELIAAAAEAYGGTVTPWANPAGGPEFEVVTTTPVLDIIVPPGQPVSQWYELWSAGGCQRRCDGITNVLDMSPCACPADVQQRLELAKDGRACKATTRLNVMLPALPDLGVWRLESHGFYAAVELAGAAEILAMASATGRLIPARLRLEQREKKIPGKPTNRYAVPIIEFVETRMADLAIIGPGAGQPQLASGRPSIPALPSTTLPERSDFRAQPSQPPTIVADGSFVEGPTEAEAVATTTGPDLATTIRAAAAVSDLAGRAPQAAVNALLAGPFASWDRAFVLEGIAVLFGSAAVNAPTAAQVAALATVAGAIPGVDLVAAWRAMVAGAEAAA